MNASINKLKKRRRIFGWVFVVSFVVFILLNSIVFLAPDNVPIESNNNIEALPHIIETAAGDNFALILSAISFLTSLTALLGFFSTTALAWRKEKREERHSELELRKKELEIEKLQTELKAREDNDVS